MKEHLTLTFFQRKGYFFLILLIFSFFFFPGYLVNQIDGGRIMGHIQKQLSFGPRLPGSDASKLTADYFKDYLKSCGWQIEFQEFDFDGITLRNIIGKNSPKPPQLIIGTHYDTRQFSDEDLDKTKHSLPVPGAIDGASGSAIILELGKLLSRNDLSVWLVFFDGEDQGKIKDWQWSIGSQYFVQNLDDLPNKVVILDMLGDNDLRVFEEKNSNLNLSEEIWSVAQKMGYGKYFINEQKYSMIDDHLPFINKGIPSALLIDFDYSYWHTTSDTLNKVSRLNLEIVTKVMLKWVNSF